MSIALVQLEGKLEEAWSIADCYNTKDKLESKPNPQNLSYCGSIAELVDYPLFNLVN